MFLKEPEGKKLTPEEKFSIIEEHLLKYAKSFTTEEEKGKTEKFVSDDLDTSRYGLFPIRHKGLEELYQKQVTRAWKSHEPDMSKDLEWLKKLSLQEIFCIFMILIFFSEADGIVQDFITSVMGELMRRVPEISQFEGYKAGMETVHRETYAKLIDTLIVDKKTKLMAFEAIKNFECVRKKAQWIVKYKNDPTMTKGEKILAIILGELLQFAGSFAIPAWYRSQGVENGFTSSNHVISIDESIHGSAGIYYLMYFGKGIDRGEGDLGITMPTQERAHAMVKEVVEIECEFMTEIMGDGFPGMTTTMMHQYIKKVADNIMDALELDRIYDAVNPFNFMDTNALFTVVNFFEGKTGEYEHHALERPLDNLVPEELQQTGSRHKGKIRAVKLLQGQTKDQWCEEKIKNMKKNKYSRVVQ